MRSFVILGIASVVAGGLVAAVARPTKFADGSWLAAYLVLVGGVSQIALGTGQGVLARRAPSTRLVAAEVAAWNLGLLAVTLGTLAPAVILTALGGLATAVALAWFLSGVRQSGTVLPTGVLHLYRGLAAFVLVSTPVGLLLAWSRHA
jgi:hypothetical protein